MTNTTEQTADVAAVQAEGAKPGTTKVARAKKAPASPRTDTKAELILKRLRSAKGATLAQLIEATGWQAHSVRGYLSGTVKKKLRLQLVSEAGKDGVRRYRVAEAASEAPATAASAS